jgi:enoyl-CoA hydratase/carnithine racemase
VTGQITLRLQDGIAVLELDNEARRNAVSAAMWERIGAHVAALGARDDIRALLLRGKGRAFCAGADIADFAANRSGTGNARGYDDLVEFTCRAIEALPQPTIALVHGPCFGAGVSLAGSCDLRVASEDVVFALPAGRLGLGYDVRGVARLIRVFGAGIASWMLLTADRLPAARAFATGGVHAVAPADELDAMAFELAARIARNAPLTLHAAKMAIRAQDGRANAPPVSEAERLVALADASADYAEGRAAFAEKRAPRFQGH